MSRLSIVLFLIFGFQGFAFAQADLEKFLFTNNETGLRAGLRTDGALVIQHDKVIYEKYARGFDENKQHIMWSTSKTVMALLYGVAIKENRVKLDESICDFVAAVQPGQCEIKVKNLLEWSSTLSWKEEYEKGDILNSSVLTMLYGEGHNDMAAYVLSRPMMSARRPQIQPGTLWRYSSGDSILASKVLAKVFAPAKLTDVFREKLFTPLGIENWTWEVDSAGTISGAFYFYITARDLAKLGKLFLGHGVVDGKEIVAPEFIDFMQTTPAAFLLARPDDEDIKNVSGAHLWVNKPVGDAGSVMAVAKPWPNAPSDLVISLGHWGQYLITVPSLDLIAVRIGDTRDKSFILKDFITELMKFVNYGGASVKVVPGDGNNTAGETKKSSVAESGFWPNPIHWFKKKTREAQLAVAYVAKNFCSCYFVVKNTEANCRDYASIDQASPKLTFDLATHTARAKLFFWSSVAHYSGEVNSGCVLDANEN